MHKDVKEILYSQQQIAERCRQLGAQLESDYRGKEDNTVFVAILKGSLPFMADLIRCIELDFYIDTMTVSSYEGTESVGKIIIKKDIDCDVAGRNIVIVEDIMDTGVTLKALKTLLLERGANDVKIVCLLNKQARRTEDIKPDYIGFEIEDQFVIGYGLDFNQKYRNLPYVGILKEECYK